MVTNNLQTLVASNKKKDLFLTHITSTSRVSFGFSRCVFFTLGSKLKDQPLPGHTILMAERKEQKI